MRLSELILHLSFCRSHATAASENVWLTRLHNNWPKKAQVKLLTMTEDPLTIVTVNSTVFLLLIDVIEMSKKPQQPGCGGLFRTVSAAEVTWFPWLLVALVFRRWEPYSECRIWETSSNCVQPCCWWWMDTIKESYWGVNYCHNWILLPWSDKSRGLLSFQGSPIIQCY